ncbi:glycoside hydrolase family 35 protein [Terriglobus roseus]|nr:beta-galactosidase family protein [Terriglobus roseus]
MSFLKVARTLVSVALLPGVSLLAGAQRSPATVSPLQVAGGHLELRGKPFQIVSGELEYARIPREYWRDRLRKAHAMGLNAITAYVFWNVHEPRPSSYDFNGQNDVKEFLREAQQEGLYVILRPGPYVCAEWDLGGYPSWLLKDHSMVLRGMQPQFQEAATRWMLRLGKELAPLQADRGGPILAVQVENEYGSFGEDHAYMKWMQQLVIKAGFGGSLLYTADGADVLDKGSLPGVFAGIDFGTGDADRSIKLKSAIRPDSPTYVAEYWDGWFDHWGERHQTTDAAKQESEVRAMLHSGASVSLYMVHGGTSFGWMNGANNDHDGYQPDVSSYDYDAPLDESGRPRPKYFRMRDVIAQETHIQPIPVPVSSPMISFPAVTLTESVSLWDTLPPAVERDTPPSMEDMDQAYGYILYRRQLTGSGKADLTISDLHSYARVYLDGKLVGVMDRRLGQKSILLAVEGTHRLDILVENSGRINFKTAIRGERAGVLGAIRYGDLRLAGWKVYPLPFAPPPVKGYTTAACSGPCFSQGTFQIAYPGDTYLNTQQLGKGVIWVNGHLLGRFWNIGPSGTLYLPGVWLRKGSNTLKVLDLDGGGTGAVRGQDAAFYFEPKNETAQSLGVSN